jgi:hypothetical protein
VHAHRRPLLPGSDKQCLRESPLSTALPFTLHSLPSQILLKPEVFDPSGSQEVHRPTLTPLGHLKKYRASSSSHPHSQNSAETLDSSQSAEAKIGTRLSFLSSQPGDEQKQSLSEICFDFVPCLAAERAPAESNKSANPLTDSSDSGFVRLSSQPTVLDLPSKIRRQDTFGDEFYESWDRGVAVAAASEEDLNGNISLVSHSRGHCSDEEESDTSDDEQANSARNEIEKWKQMALELQDQVIHLRASSRGGQGAKGGPEEDQRKRKKLRKGQRLHEALAEEQANERGSQGLGETKEAVEPSVVEPSKRPLQSPTPPRQSKALPPKLKLGRLRKS